MNLGVDHPWLLSLAVLCLLPLLRTPFKALGYSWNAMLPADPGSRWVSALTRASGILALALLVLGMAGLHRQQHGVQRIGTGANIVLLLDRSRSMDDSFAGKTPSGGEESKSVVAERLLQEFIAGRREDLFGVAAFSTAPLFVLPLTDNRPALEAAIRASKRPALAQTHVSKGLAMALSYFEGRALSGSRIVLLVSDGAAVIDPQSEARLRRWFRQNQIRLYWIFLRTSGSHGLFERPSDPLDDDPQSAPERYLHLFFTGLGIPYRAYEAENPDALRAAMNDVSQLENQPFRYLEQVPRQDLQGLCYGSAALFLAVLLAAKLLEIGTWREA